MKKDFLELTGPWTGLSIQAGMRIQEAISLTITPHQIEGLGTDNDGDFVLDGSYDARRQRVSLTRRYTWTSNGTDDGVGVPYQYDGYWDGEMVVGAWHQRDYPANQGTFEMWPDKPKEEEMYSLEALKLELSSTI